MDKLTDSQIANCAQQNLNALDDIEEKLNNLYEISEDHDDVVKPILEAVVTLRHETMKMKLDAEIRKLQKLRESYED